MLTTQPATETDRLFLANLFLRAMRTSIEACRGYWDEGKEREQFFEQLQLSETRVIQSDGNGVGFFMAAACENDNDINLHTLCIAPEHQGRGFGTAILRTLLDDARARKQSVVLSVLKTNSAARSFYGDSDSRSLMKRPTITTCGLSHKGIALPVGHGEASCLICI